MNKRKFLFVCMLLTFTGCASIQKNTILSSGLSPFDFGLANAKNGEERFRVLYNTHVTALSLGVDVNYSNIDSISLVIPRDAKSIPLTNNNNFEGVVFNVKNNSKDFFLFTLINDSKSIKISKEDIDRGFFNGYKELNNGYYLLVVSDSNLWVENREGYSYGHKRRDLLVVGNGEAFNKTIMPYNNEQSVPVCYYYRTKAKKTSFSNIVLKREKGSNYKTFLCRITGVNGLFLEDVNIYTPENQGESDKAIMISDCANVTFNHVNICGTYSRTDYSGYGIEMDNIFNFKAKKLYAHGNWGVFGTNNMNTVVFDKCDINRFDIHCYGRNVSFKDVTFRNNYNQFASVFGSISFERCKFIDFIPLVNGPSYNAYVGYDIVLKDCELIGDEEETYLITEGYIDDRVNKRQELSKRCLPNVTINNMELNLGDNVKRVVLFHFFERGKWKQPIDYISSIKIDGLKANYSVNYSREVVDFIVADVSVNIVNPLHQSFIDIDLSSCPTKSFDSPKGRIINNLNPVDKKSTVRCSRIKAIMEYRETTKR